MTITALPPGWQAHDIGIRLHLGCGSVALPKPWRNIDRRYQPGVDEVNNIGLLQHYEPNSVDEIYCCHALDHFDRWTYKTVLRRWFDLLKPGGVLRISTPDFENTAKLYLHTGDLSSLIGQLYASQDYDGNCRKWVWDYSLAARELEAIGFYDVKRYSADKFLRALDNSLSDASLLTWRASVSYLISTQDKTGGLVNLPETKDELLIFRSLNITARKPE